MANSISGADRSPRPTGGQPCGAMGASRPTGRVDCGLSADIRFSLTGREMSYTVWRLLGRRIRDARACALRRNPRPDRGRDEECGMDIALEGLNRAIGLHDESEQAILNWIRSQKNGGWRI